MAVEKVQLGVTAIKELLDGGYTWLKKDDLGFGSIQEKYQASDVQIAAIRKHPLLKDLETTARIFVIVDDTKDAAATPTTETKEPTVTGAESPMDGGTLHVGDELAAVDTDSFSAFASL